MKSRYDLINFSSENDTDLQNYPDILSLDYTDFIYKYAPSQIDVSDLLIERPYVLSYAIYKDTDLDDLVLDINNIPYRTLLEADEDTEIVLFPDIKDLKSFREYYLRLNGIK
jgi:hypothetical protein